MGNMFSGVNQSDEVIGQAIGVAAMCWENNKAGGIFDVARAAKIAKDAHERLLEIAQGVQQQAGQEPAGRGRTLKVWKEYRYRLDGWTWTCTDHRHLGQKRCTFKAAVEYAEQHWQSRHAAVTYRAPALESARFNPSPPPVGYKDGDVWTEWGSGRTWVRQNGKWRETATQAAWKDTGGPVKNSPEGKRS